MAKIPLDKESHRFDHRVGSEGFTFGGILQDPDPGANPPGRPRMILNGRFQGGGIISRPPYSYVDYIPSFTYKDPDDYADSQVEWNVKSMSEHHPTRHNSDLWIGRWDANSSYLQIIDQPFKPAEDIASYPSVVQKPPVVERYNGEIFVGDTGYLRRIYRVGLALADLPTDDILYTFEGFRAYAMSEFAGRLFVFVADPLGVGTSYVFSYDGDTVYSEVTLGTDGADGASFQEWNGKLFLGIKGDTSLHYRDAAGNWNFETDAAFRHSGFGNAMVATSWGASGSPGLIIHGDTTVSQYTEPGGTPTLTVTGLPSGWTSATVGCSIGSYWFRGGSKILGGDSVDTPIFTGPSSTSVRMTSAGANSIIAKGMAVFCNRVYYCLGYRDPANGGGTVGFFRTPRSVHDPSTSGGLTGSDYSFEYLKGDH